MKMTRTQITVEQIVSQVLTGGMDFSNTVLGTKKNLSSCMGFQIMQMYLKRLSIDEFYQNPLIIDGSDWSCLTAIGLYLPFLRAVNANINRADLKGVDFRGADMTGADLRATDMTGANLSGADMSGADLSWARFGGTYLRKTDLRKAKLSRAILYCADLEKANLGEAVLEETVLNEAINLRTAKNISDAIYKETIISPEQYGIIINAFERAGKTVEDNYFLVVK